MLLAAKLMGAIQTGDLMFVASATGVTSIASMPTHQAGDILIGFAARNSTTSAPGKPSGWTTVTSSIGSINSASLMVAYKVAASGAETSGTWSNASGLIIAVYRNSSGLSIGNSSSNTNFTTASITYGAYTPSAATSFVMAFVATASGNVAAISLPPTGMVNRNYVANSNISMAMHDTNEGVASWPSTAVNIGVSISGYATIRKGIDQI